MSKSRSCKKLIREKLHLARRNKVSLCELRLQAVFPPQMRAALWGSWCKCESWLPILVSMKAPEEAEQNNCGNDHSLCEDLFLITSAVVALKCRVSSNALFIVSAHCRMTSWYCMSRSMTACWSVSLRRSSSACWPEGLRRKLRGSYHSSLVTRKYTHRA